MELIRGKELAQKILKQITEHPETHDQGSWVNAFNECGTTYCIAGWAVAFNSRQGGAEPGDLSDTRRALARELNTISAWSILGQELLDLDDDDAELLFYSTDEEAPRMLADLFELEHPAPGAE